MHEMQYEQEAITWKEDASFGVLLAAAEVASCTAGSSMDSNPTLGLLFLDGAAPLAGRAQSATCRSPSEAESACSPLGLNAMARTGNCSIRNHLLIACLNRLRGYYITDTAKIYVLENGCDSQLLFMTLCGVSLTECPINLATRFCSATFHNASELLPTITD